MSEDFILIHGYMIMNNKYVDRHYLFANYCQEYPPLLQIVPRGPLVLDHLVQLKAK